MTNRNPDFEPLPAEASNETLLLYEDAALGLVHGANDALTATHVNDSGWLVEAVDRLHDLVAALRTDLHARYGKVTP